MRGVNLLDVDAVLVESVADSSVAVEVGNLAELQTTKKNGREGVGTRKGQRKKEKVEGGADKRGGNEKRGGEARQGEKEGRKETELTKTVVGSSGRCVRPARRPEASYCTERA